jgi:hypothetical protein
MYRCIEIKSQVGQALQVMFKEREREREREIEIERVRLAISKA